MAAVGVTARKSAAAGARVPAAFPAEPSRRRRRHEPIHRVLERPPCCRLLLVEDDPDRIARFTAWCPPDARLVVARGGGRALGLLERDPGRVYAVNDAERLVTGTQVVQGILRCLDPEIPILIHSMNRGAARRMSTTLIAAGFGVSAIPMADLTRDRFLAWLDIVREVQRLLGPE